MPDGYWKTKYSNTIREKNKRLLDDMPMASLLKFGEDAA
jgi:hypothetical protein